MTLDAETMPQNTEASMMPANKVEKLAKLYLEGHLADISDETLADIERDRMWVSPRNYDTTMDINPIYNFILQAIHDGDHYSANSDFSLEGEIATYNETARRAPCLGVQKILYSESVLKPAACILLGHPPESKIVFP
jgi:hypothetical protein